MNKRICLLGNNGVYTKIVANKFDKLGIKYTLIIEQNNTVRGSRIRKIMCMPCTIYTKLNRGKYTALSKFSFFTYKSLLIDIIYSKSKKNIELLSEYIDYRPKTDSIYTTAHVNNVNTLKIIKDNKFDIGVFAGVGIVDSDIIDQFSMFCLNAHPAPLPECRGAGALENTLFYGLDPSVSVHFATAGIDEGSILKVEKIQLDKYDDFNSISTKLTIQCGKTLAAVVNDLLSGVEYEAKSNHGKLHYWKDCTKNVQKVALWKLSQVLRKLKR